MRKAPIFYGASRLSSLPQTIKGQLRKSASEKLASNLGIRSDVLRRQIIEVINASPFSRAEVNQLAAMIGKIPDKHLALLHQMAAQIQRMNSQAGFHQTFLPLVRSYLAENPATGDLEIALGGLKEGYLVPKFENAALRGLDVREAMALPRISSLGKNSSVRQASQNPLAVSLPSETVPVVVYDSGISIPPNPLAGLAYAP